MTRIPTRLAFALPIVVFWVVMMGLLVKRHGVWPGGATAPVGSGRSLNHATDTWLGLFAGEGQRVGTLHLRRAPQARDGEPGLSHDLAARLQLQVLGRPTDLDISGSLWRPHQGEGGEFDFEVRSGESEFRFRGRLVEGEIRGEVDSGGEVLELRLAVDEELLMTGGLGSTFALPALEVGQEVRVASLDPLTLAASSARVRCVARQRLRVGGEVVETRVMTVVSGGLSSRVWVDVAGDVVRAETPLGLALERIPPQEALSELPAGEWGDLLDGVAVHPTGQRPLRGARGMTVKLAGVELLDLPTDGVQSRRGEAEYRITVPAAPSVPAPSGGEEVAPHLRGDAFVQSQHPTIVRQADAIVGDEEDPWVRAKKLHDWVFERLEKEPVLSIPSALEVLARGQGDCNEHTVLFAALARAAGVPTRIAIGVVWSEAYEGFYYHAWPEVYIGRWIWMDPTLGQPLADATHIKLLNGGIETWPRLLPFLGQLRVEVLEVESP